MSGKCSFVASFPTQCKLNPLPLFFAQDTNIRLELKWATFGTLCLRHRDQRTASALRTFRGPSWWNSCPGSVGASLYWSQVTWPPAISWMVSLFPDRSLVQKERFQINSVLRQANMLKRRQRRIPQCTRRERLPDNFLLRILFILNKACFATSQSWQGNGHFFFGSFYCLCFWMTRAFVLFQEIMLDQASCHRNKETTGVW